MTYDPTVIQLVTNAPDPTLTLAATPLVTGLVEVAKRSGLPSRYAPIASLVFALPVMALLVDDPTSREAFIAAIGAGLASSGLYSGLQAARSTFAPAAATAAGTVEDYDDDEEPF